MKSSESAESAEDVSEDLFFIFHVINNAALGSIIGTVGITGNLMNLAVFYNQGFGDTVNISLFALSLCDLCSLLTLQVYNLFMNPLFLNSVDVIQMEAQHLMAGWPHAFFTRLSGAFTAYITLERCLCVLIPLKVKTVLTPPFSVTVLVSIFVVLALTLIPDYSSCYYGWKFDPKRNGTAFGLLFRVDREKMAHLTFVLSNYTQILSYVAVVVFTTILVLKLHQKSKWRASTSSSGQDSQKNRQTRENRTVLMIILIASIYCICFLPYVVIYTVTSIVPDFNIAGKYTNAFSATVSFAFMVDAINTSLNTFVYFHMSSKYRKTAQIMFACNSGEKKGTLGENKSG